MSDKTIRILLIEDNPGDAHFIREVLTDAMMADPSALAFDLTCARRLSSGLRQLARGGIDVLLLDLSLPDSQGLDTFVKTHAQALGIPIIVLSGLGDKEVALEAVQKGAQDYLVKGEASGSLLVRAIRYAIERKRAEEETRILAELLDTSPASITVHDYDGNFIYANQKTLDLHGYTRDELFALNLHQLDVPESERLIAPRLQELRERGEASFEAAHCRKDGTTIPLHVNAKAARWGGQEVILSIATDISERKQAEEALRKSETEYRTLFETMAQGVVYQAADGRITSANPAAERILGLTLDQMNGRTSMDPRWKAIHEDGSDFPGETHPAMIALRSGKEVRNVVMGVFNPRHGEYRWININAMPQFRPGESTPYQVYTTFDDITARKRAEEALRESEEKYRQLFELESDALFLIDNETGRILEVNAAASALYGYSREELLTKRNTDLSAEPEDTQRVTQTTPVIADQVVTIPLRFHRKRDGSVFPVEITGRFFVRQGRSVHIAAIRDITERKQAEEALQESEQRFRTLAEASFEGIALLERGVFVDLNDQLAHMLGYSRSELIGKPVMEVVAQESRDLVAEAIRSGRLEPYEHLALRKDGTVFPVEVRARTTQMAGRQLRVTAIHDITERKRAEEALRESEARYRAVIESQVDLISRYLPDTTLTFVNDAYCKFYGKTREELIGHSYMSMIAPEFRELVRKETEELAKAPRPLAGEYLNYRHDGKECWIQWVVECISDENGRVVELQAVGRDITKRRQAEEALRKAEIEKETILDSQMEHVVYQDREHKILWPNQAACESVQMTREELIGRHCYEIWAQRSERCEDCPVAPAMETGQQQEIEKTTPDGRAWFIRGYPVRDANDEIVGAIEVTRDITERKQAEAERERLLAQVREQAHRVQQIMDTVPEGVLLLDSDCCVVLANPLGKKDLATLASAQVGNTLTRLGDRPLAELLTSPPKGLWHEVTTDSRFFQVIARRIEDGPSPKGWVLVIRDMTQQYETERRAQQQERLAAVGQLAAGIAHDFNNIMAVITLYAGMLARAPDLPAKAYERLGIIHQQALRASDLIQQILDFSRRAVLERGPMDLAVFIKEQVKLLERTLPESIKIELVYGRDEYVVNGDPTRLQQAVMNLAANARDAMPEGGRLRIDLERMQIEDAQRSPLPDMPAGEWVRVAVTDTGVGIPPDVLPHIFEPFFTTKTVGGGTGLGLAQVHGIVGQHDGYVDVKTEVGVGTTFALYLPALAVPRPQPPPLGTEQLPQGHGETILVVEDAAATRQAVVSGLETLGYRVLEAANGQKALVAFEQHAGEIELVLSDVVMPEMSGQALFQALRQRDPEVKVVLMTGHPLEGQIESLRAQGLNGWLPKPPGIEKLAEAVARALEERE